MTSDFGVDRQATSSPFGCIIVPYGATARIDEEAGIDLAGADNLLTPSNRSTTPYLNAWNSTLVQYEKHEGDIELIADAYAELIIPMIVRKNQWSSETIVCKNQWS